MRLPTALREGGDENEGPGIGRSRGHWMQTHWKNNFFLSSLSESSSQSLASPAFVSSSYTEYLFPRPSSC